MSVINNSLLLTAPAGGAYQVSRSLRFNSGDSAYLNRTPASTGNRFTWTWAGWVKRSSVTTTQVVMGVRVNGSTYTLITFLGGELYFYNYGSSGGNAYILTNAVYRDPSAWYHFTVVYDANNATQSDRMRIYANGVRVTDVTAGYPTSTGWNSLFSSTNAHNIGRDPLPSNYLSGYLAEVHFIDGQALDPSSFTETDATTGQLIPKAFTGSYGTNGFKLNFSDNSTAAALGTDTSSNGNTWTVNNLSVTAGSGNDSLVDTPTSYGTDTGAGGEVRGNYCTLNPIANFNGSTISNGNLDVVTAGSAGGGAVFGTIAIPSSGKYYWEVVVTSTTLPSVDIAFAGIVQPVSGTYQTNVSPYFAAIYFLGGGIGGTVFSSSGSKTNGTDINVGDVCGIAVNVDSGSISFYKNGVANGSVTGFTFGTNMVPYVEDNSGGAGQSSITANFGQRAFAYTAPSGFKALCDTNLPTPVIAKPNTVFDIALWTGQGNTNDRTITTSFNPDLVWIKSRSDGTYNHALFDSNRGFGTNNVLSSNTSGAQGATDEGYVKSTTSTSMTLGVSGGGNAYYNGNNFTYVGWTWDAGTSTVTNTAGSITSQVRANASAGFSVVTYTATGSTLTVGHGLGAAPELIIIKGRTSTNSWAVYTKVVGTSGFLLLNSTAAVQNYNVWNNTSPTSTVFTVGAPFDEGNASGVNHVAYCFAPVSGYSNAFSYAGNGSSDGPMVWLGFKPRLIIYKRTDSTSNWSMYDTARDTYNITDRVLAPNSSAAEAQYASDIVDVLSNGFKIRSTGAAQNASGGTYIGFAFAESPFAYSRAR